MNTIIAVCGLDCAQCPAYQATQANDEAALEALAAQWRKDFNAPDITAASVVCDGCNTGGRLSGYCNICEIRKCAGEKGFSTCASCQEYRCDKLVAFHNNAPGAKERLDLLRM